MASGQTRWRRCQWPPEADAIVSERMRARSKETCVGRTCTFPERWYRRDCQQFFLIISLVSVVIGSVQLYRTTLTQNIDADEDEIFKETLCTTTSSFNTGTMLSCNCSDGNDGGSCTKLYPCFSLNVSYLLSGFPADHGQLHGQLFKDEETIENSEALQHGCMVYYSRCEYHDPADEITQFSTIFGAPGTQFGCFYNRLNLDQILLDFYPDKVDPLFFSIALLLSALPILVGVFIFTYMSHICGWQHPCTSKPTIEILLEVQRRRQLGELPPSESQENLNVFAQPDLEGEVVAPPPYSRQGLSFDVEEDSRFQTQFPTVQEQNLPSEPPPPYSAVEDYERR